MAFPAALKLVSLPSFSIHNPYPFLSNFDNFPSTFPSISPYPNSTHSKPSNKHCRIWQQSSKFSPLCLSYRFSTNGADHEDDDDAENCSFDEAVELFNRREYYKCHDYLEALWNKAEEPTRTLIHGILQCAVGFHHLFNKVGNRYVCGLLRSMKPISNMFVCFLGKMG